MTSPDIGLLIFFRFVRFTLLRMSTQCEQSFKVPALSRAVIDTSFYSLDL